MGKFFGTYSRTLDEKGRLLIPAKLLSKGIQHYYVLRGFEGCLSVYEEDAFEKLEAKLDAMDFMDEESRTFIRLMTSSIQELPVDSHGRVLLGRDTLRDYAISNEVTLIGVLDHFEIWDATAYARYNLEHSGNYEALAGRKH